MTLFEFVNKFPDEEHCKQKWREIRIKEGVVCPKCGSTEHYWKKDKESFECKHCGYRQSLRANTVMHGSQMPFRYWFIAIYLLTSSKHSFSTAELQRELGHKFYEPIWAMVHKLREAMGKRDDLYKLGGELELDDGFFTIELEEVDREKAPLKKGRGSQRKCKVLVMAESEKVTPSDKDKKKGLKDRKVGHIKMKVIDNLKAETIDDMVKQCVSESSKIDSDKSTSYVNLKDIVTEHCAKVLKDDEVGKFLPWVHIVIGNAKRLLLDIHHAVTANFLQGYLNEFCYKFNRRYFGKGTFDRLLVACVTSKNTFRY